MSLRIHLILMRTATVKKAAEIAQWGDVIATKAPDLNLIPETHVVKAED